MNLTQTEARERTNGLICVGGWEYYEAGTMPGLDKLLAIAFALETTVEELLPLEYRASVSTGVIPVSMFETIQAEPHGA